MNRISPCILCDMLSNLDTGEVEDKKLICDYWNQIIEKNAHGLPKRVFSSLEVKPEEVYGHGLLKNNQYDHALHNAQTWNFLDGENYIKLKSSHFKDFSTLGKEHFEDEFEVLKGLAQKCGQKITISRITAKAHQLDALKKILLPYVIFEDIDLLGVSREFLIANPKSLWLDDPKVKIALHDTGFIQRPSEFLYTVEELVDIMIGKNQLPAPSRYKVIFSKRGLSRFFPDFGKAILKKFQVAEDPGTFIKHISFTSPRNSPKAEELLEYLKSQGLSCVYECFDAAEERSNVYNETSSQTFQNKRPDGWKLNIALTICAGWDGYDRLEATILEKDEEETEEQWWRSGTH